MSITAEAVREHFPALQLSDAGVPRGYLDNPAGTQVPQHVIDRMSDYLIRCNANHLGLFRTSQESDALLDAAHRGMADLLNAPHPEEIIFGPNMTTLTLSLSRSFGRLLSPGDEIILSRMDHDANVWPWHLVAEDRGAIVKWLDFDRENYRFDLDQLQGHLNGNVKLVAVCYASNALGTINPVKEIVELSHEAGAAVYIDAVHYLPHGPVDVQALDCDFLVCSAYKFFGPHQGILWGKKDLLERLEAYKVRPASENVPGKFETGTQNHEGQAGTVGTLEYLEQLGKEMGEEYIDRFAFPDTHRRTLHAAMTAIQTYERELSEQLIAGLQTIRGINIHGITAPDELDERVPTVSFTVDGLSPTEIAEKLGKANIFVWNGHYYALEVVRSLGLEDKGGMVRVGPVHYNTKEEIERFLDVLSDIVKRK